MKTHRYRRQTALRSSLRWTATLGTLVAGLLLPGDGAAGQSLIDRGDGHRIRPFMGAGTAGYNLGLEGEYSLLPYVSVVGSLQGWVGEGEIECFQVTGAEGPCPPTDEGWGAGIGVRLSAVDRYSWWLFVQGDAGFYSFSSTRTGLAPSLGGRFGIVMRLRSWLEVETAIKYQYVTDREAASVTYEAEHWGGLLLGFGMPIG